MKVNTEIHALMGIMQIEVPAPLNVMNLSDRIMKRVFARLSRHFPTRTFGSWNFNVALGDPDENWAAEERKVVGIL